MTNNPLDEFAPYPQTEDEVTAETLARSLTVQAQVNVHRMLTSVTGDGIAASANRVVDVFSTVKLLRALQAVAPDNVADQVARELWADLHDGTAVHERLGEWLTGYGIDPEAVNRAADDAMREAAA